VGIEEAVLDKGQSSSISNFFPLDPLSVLNVQVVVVVMSHEVHLGNLLYRNWRKLFTSLHP